MGQRRVAAMPKIGRIHKRFAPLQYARGICDESYVKHKKQVMKKAIPVFVVLFAFLLSVSARTERVFKAADGYKAPALHVANATDSISLEELRGSYVLVNFWSVADAESRVAAGEYDALAKSMAGKQFRVLSVNTDDNERLFREIVRRDGLNDKTQYRATGTQASKLNSEYGLDGGAHSYLINPEGRIVATNPSANTVASLI